MNIAENLRLRAKNLKNEITAVYYAYQDRNIGLPAKIAIFFTLGYALSPVDLIPDFIPVLGYLDDLLILPALISLSIRLIPEEVMKEARLKAKREPLQLKKNRGFALVFILIWIILIASLLLAIYRLYSGQVRA